MLKLIKKKIQSDMYLIIIILILASLTTWYYMPKDIYIKLDGIDFQKSDLTAEKFVTLEIVGKYTRGMMIIGNSDLFDGKIIIDGDIYSSSRIYIRDGKRIVLRDASYNTMGFMFTKRHFTELTVIKGKMEPDGVVWDEKFISAPCKNRQEAVIIFNNLIKKEYKEMQIN